MILEKEETKQNAIIITVPKTTSWEDYLKEIEKVKDGKEEMNFKVSNLPKNISVGDRCYIVYNGLIKGWMTISSLGEKEFICSTTGKKWKGKFISRSGEFHPLNEEITYQGFQGYRYFDYNNICQSSRSINY